MKKALIVVIVSSLCFSSCKLLKNKGGKGNVDGLSKGQISARETSQGWSPIRPIDMVPIPSGSFVMGQTDYDFTQQGNAPVKTVTVSGFFMEETEVTNQKYRVFINYVRDSIARWNLAEKAQELGLGYVGDDNYVEGGLADYAFLDPSVENAEEQGAYYEFIASQQDGRDGSYDETMQLNWDVPLIWDVNEYADMDYTEVMEALYYPPDERFNNERLIDVRKLNYKFEWVDTQSAARARGRGKRSQFIRELEVNVYPDTTVWARDFEYAYNEPMHENYFSHDAFVDYPVVGVTWDQANAYCAFKTQAHNAELKKAKKKLSRVLKYRLPSESEWEYAARGALQDAPYPWGGPHLTDDRGCYLANFKPKRGDYLESHDEKDFGYLYTSPVKTFPPNQYGLYDMAGNVAEWTSSSYNNASYQTTATLNPSLGRYETNLKTVRGGSWKDIGYLLMVSSRDFEVKDSARSFVGFRTAQTIPEGAKVRFRTVK